MIQKTSSVPYHLPKQTNKQTNKQKENLYWSVYVSEWKILMVIEIGSAVFGLVL